MKLVAGPLNSPSEEISGFKIFRALLSPDQQAEMVEAVRSVVASAPLVRPMTAWGKPMTVRMTSAGRVGWVIERGRYRYADRHPEQGSPWPGIPSGILDVWSAVSDWPDHPDSCLVNWYDEKARMGLHQDKDEGDLSAPVVSVSLGQSAVFRMGGTERSMPTTSTVLDSGDVVVMGGGCRLAYHGVDRIISKHGPHPLTGNGRLNLTLRVVSV